MTLYRSTLLGKGLQSPMDLLCSRQARSYLQMSNAAKMNVGQATSRLQAEAVRPTSKNQVQATSNLLTLRIHMIYETPLSTLWYLGKIISILGWWRLLILFISIFKNKKSLKVLNNWIIFKCRQAFTMTNTWLHKISGKCHTYLYLYLPWMASLVVWWVTPGAKWYPTYLPNIMMWWYKVWAPCPPLPT